MPRRLWRARGRPVAAGLLVMALAGLAPVGSAAAGAGTTVVATSVVAPGVEYQQLVVDDGTGPVVVHVLRVDPATPGIAFDLASGPKVASRQPVPDLMDASAVAAVNGDFFDIRDTDAPLGVAVDRQRGLRNGVAFGWNHAFWVGAGGRPGIGPLRVTTQVLGAPGHRPVPVASVDSPSVSPATVGLYDRHWGVLRHYRVVDGQHRGVRMVVVRAGRVVANRTSFPPVLAVRATVLVGRGRGAVALAGLQVGDRVRTRSRLSQPARVAVTGSDDLLRDSVPVAVTSADPSFVTGHYARTAVGIDSGTGEVLLVTVDGGSPTSPGYTLPQLTALMSQLGADDALNLDGGGSATMVARGDDGALAVLNTPSDGHPRPVANGLEVTYDPPA